MMVKDITEPLKILPRASNHIILKSGDIEIDVMTKTDGSEIGLIISDNATWETNKTFSDLGNKNHIDVKKVV